VIILCRFFGFDDCISRKMCNFAVMNQNEGQQDVPDKEKKELRGIGTLPTTKRRD
jgi:hypothetical protein